MIVKFTNGEEKDCDADSAALSGPVFVLYKYNRTRRRLESAETLPAEQVAWARLPNGDIVVGRGVVKSG